MIHDAVAIDVPGTRTVRARAEVGDQRQQIRHAQERVLGEENEQTMSSLNDLAWMLGIQSRFVETVPLYERALQIKKRLLGDEHPKTLNALASFAWSLGEVGRLEEAARLGEVTLTTCNRVLGAEHPKTVSALAVVARIYTLQGRYAEAEPLYQQEIGANRRRRWGEENPNTLVFQNELGFLYTAQGRYDEAELLLAPALETTRRAIGETRITLSIMNGLAETYLGQGRYEEAEPLIVRTVEIRRKTIGAERPNTLISLNNLGVLHRGQERYDLARLEHEEALSGIRRALGDRHWREGVFLFEYGLTLIKINRRTEAESALLESHDILTTGLGATHNRTARTAKPSLISTTPGASRRRPPSIARCCRTLRSRSREIRGVAMSSADA